MKRVVLCPNPYKDRGLKVTRQAMSMLGNAGFEVKLCPEFMDEDVPVDLTGLEVSELYDVVDGASLVVSFGGDGTIMHTARRLIGHRVPILGVNLGTVGFLTELESQDLSRVITAADGNYMPSPRMMLKVELERNGRVIFSDYALNDAAVHGISQTMRLVASGDGRKITEYSGDGLVVSTPTGSTAYSMSAGGPLVEPTAENIILTPICAHALAARSFVLTPNRVITVNVGCPRARRAMLSVDGGSFEVIDGDVLRVRKSGHQTMFAHVSSKDYYDILYEKLGDRK